MENVVPLEISIIATKESWYHADGRSRILEQEISEKYRKHFQRQ